MSGPSTIAINAWMGAVVAESPLDGKIVDEFAKGGVTHPNQFLLPAEAPSSKDWRHEKVGWGLILPENDQLSNADKAAALDAPEAIRKLLAARGGAPVFRYAPDSPHRFTHLRRYLPNGTRVDPKLVGSDPGVGINSVPLYLLIYASPTQIPWDLQFLLHGASFVGRLDLEGDALSRYVDALIGGFGVADPLRSLVWGVDHETGDITQLMRRTIARPLYDDLHGDKDLDAAMLERGDATCPRLVASLAERKPGLIVTTSHGLTSPVNDPTALAKSLGLLVDSNYDTLSVDALLGAWQPEGAIWYAHACCSAGADATSGLTDLGTTGDVDRVLRCVAASGSSIAPLPRALLGATKPLRAFVGHVEPTFDWTLREPNTGQVLTRTIRDALYGRLYLKSPIAHAFGPCHVEANAQAKQHDIAMKAYNKGENTLDVALAARLTARDRERLVILGDPTVALPLP